MCSTFIDLHTWSCWWLGEEIGFNSLVGRERSPVVVDCGGITRMIFTFSRCLIWLFSLKRFAPRHLLISVFSKHFLDATLKSLHWFHLFMISTLVFWCSRSILIKRLGYSNMPTRLNCHFIQSSLFGWLLEEAVISDVFISASLLMRKCRNHLYFLRLPRVQLVKNDICVA